MGESGSGKTTAMRNLPPKETFYIDCDKKGLNWKGLLVNGQFFSRFQSHGQGGQAGKLPAHQIFGC